MSGFDTAELATYFTFFHNVAATPHSHKNHNNQVDFHNIGPTCVCVHVSCDSKEMNAGSQSRLNTGILSLFNWSEQTLIFIQTLRNTLKQLYIMKGKVTLLPCVHMSPKKSRENTSLWNRYEYNWIGKRQADKTRIQKYSLPELESFFFFTKNNTHTHTL